MHFTLKEMCELTNQPTGTVSAICDTNIDTDGRFTILSYYYVYLISELMEWCRMDVLKKAIPFEHMAPMIEVVKEQEPIPPVPGSNQLYPAPAVPAAGMGYPDWLPTQLGSTEHSRVLVDIYWRQMVHNARERLLEWLLAQRAKGDAT